MTPTNTATEYDEIYTVTRLNREARAVLESGFPESVQVRGEISNLARPNSGHMYFSLKDQDSQVRCAMFRSANRRLQFNPEDGMEVTARAAVGLYEGRGEYQLIVERLEPAGVGALQQAFEQLKKKLRAEGLFGDDRKQALPAFPRAIGVVTSPAGAALRDVLRVLERRYPAARVVIYPTAVQGADAARQIAAALDTADRRRECDVLIVARGGGSLEDLWSFNEEVVARAIHRCAVPVISGIGHETDFTIADFVADLRAATPSAAAELAGPNAQELADRLCALGQKLRSRMDGLLNTQRQYIAQLRKQLPAPVYLLQNLAQRVDDLARRSQSAASGGIASRRTRLAQLAGAVRERNPVHQLKLRGEQCAQLDRRLRLAAVNGIAVRRARLAQLAGAVRERNPIHQLKAHGEQCAQLDRRLRSHIGAALQARRRQLDFLRRALQAVSPLATLERGYAIVTDEQENIIRGADQLRENQVIHTKLARGSIQSAVKRLRPAEK